MQWDGERNHIWVVSRGASAMLRHQQEELRVHAGALLSTEHAPVAIDLDSQS